MDTAAVATVRSGKGLPRDWGPCSRTETAGPAAKCGQNSRTKLTCRGPAWSVVPAGAEGRRVPGRLHHCALVRGQLRHRGGRIRAEKRPGGELRPSWVADLAHPAWRTGPPPRMRGNRAVNSSPPRAWAGTSSRGLSGSVAGPLRPGMSRSLSSASAESYPAASPSTVNVDRRASRRGRLAQAVP
jgi:hypothetical protein